MLDCRLTSTGKCYKLIVSQQVASKVCNVKSDFYIIANHLEVLIVNNGDYQVLCYIQTGMFVRSK